MSESVFPMFSSRSFIVSGFTFRSLIYFEFIFVYGVRRCSSFILLQVVGQFSQHHLLKEIVFNPLYILASFVKDKVSICAWINFWAFYFVSLIYISVFVSVLYCLDDCSFIVQSEVRKVDSSSSIFLSQAIQGLLCFHTNCEFFCSSSVKNTIGNLIPFHFVCMLISLVLSV